MIGTKGRKLHSRGQTALTGFSGLHKGRRERGRRKEGWGKDRGEEEEDLKLGEQYRGGRESLEAAGVKRGKRKRICKYIVFAYEIMKKFLNVKH